MEHNLDQSVCRLNFTQIHNNNNNNNNANQATDREQHCNVLSPKNHTYTLARFEPTLFCSAGGDDDHFATPPWQQNID
jgi:hypothetical protein